MLEIVQKFEYEPKRPRQGLSVCLWTFFFSCAQKRRALVSFTVLRSNKVVTWRDVRDSRDVVSEVLTLTIPCLGISNDNKNNNNDDDDDNCNKVGSFWAECHDGGSLSHGGGGDGPEHPRPTAASA